MSNIHLIDKDSKEYINYIANRLLKKFSRDNFIHIHPDAVKEVLWSNRDMVYLSLCKKIILALNRKKRGYKKKKFDNFIFNATDMKIEYIK